MADNSKKRVLSVLHLAHRKEDKGLALFPFGVRYNKELLTLRKGDYIMFSSGEEHEVVSVSIMGLNTAVAEQMCRYIYGVPLSKVVSQWGNNAVLEGYPREAVSTDQCLMIHYIATKSNER